MSSRRRLVLPLCLALLTASLIGPAVGSGHVLSKRNAERAAFKVAAARGQATGAVLWFAGVCKRRTIHRFSCWGAVVYQDYTGCAQQIKVTAAGHRSKSRGKRVGRVYCADLSEEAQGRSGGSSSGSGGEWAICGIRSSVCIGS